MQLQVDLSRHSLNRRGAETRTLLRTATSGVAAGIGIILYIVAAIQVSTWLHFEWEAAFSMAAGLLFIGIVVVGAGRYLRFRTLAQISDRAFELYILAGGLLVLGVGIWRQVSIDQGRRRCQAELAATANSHERVKVLYGSGTSHLPTLSSHSDRSLTCEQLLHR